MKSFVELGVREDIVRAIEELGFEQPMPVQEAAIPCLLENDGDLVALAQTGTGKTAAYGIPLIQQTDVASPDAQALILSPTRELCIQIAGDLADFSKYIEGLHIIPMYGGTSIENQIRNFKRGAHIIVATPGRLLDLMNRGVVKLDTIRKFILDEADEMLNMGFAEDLEAIVSAVPEGRQTMMFSATMSKEISAIAAKYLHDAKEIVIGTRNEGAENVNHIYYMVHAKDKYLALKRVVDYYPNIYAIIFCRTRMETQEVADKLIQDGYNADSLHGELSQAQRDLTMQKFRKRQLQLLVATDVAARGLDVDDLTHVINYGLPDDTENYTHRSGRTGRAGKTGTSISIINLREKGKIRIIEKAIGKEFIQEQMPSGERICEKQLYKVMDDIERFQVSEEQIAPFLPDIMRKLDWLDKEDIIKRVVGREFMRFAEYYSNAPEIEEVTSQKSDDARKEKKEKRRIAREGFTRIFINIGKMDGIKPTSIMELINRRYSGPRVDIGRIDLMHSFSFFEVPADYADEIIASLAGFEYKHRVLNVEIASGNSSEEKKSDEAGKGTGLERRGPRKEKTARKEGDSQREKEYRSNHSDQRKSQSGDGRNERKPFDEGKPYADVRKQKEHVERKEREERPAGRKSFAEYRPEQIETKAERREKKNASSENKIKRHTASRAPETGPLESAKNRKNRLPEIDDFDDFTGGDWRQFFRSSQDGGKGKKKKR